MWKFRDRAPFDLRGTPISAGTRMDGPFRRER